MAKITGPLLNSLSGLILTWKSEWAFRLEIIISVLILEQDNRMIPIEIKARSYVSKSDARGLHAFREAYPKLNIDYGVIIYAGDRCYQVDEKTIALPYHALASKNEHIQ